MRRHLDLISTPSESTQQGHIPYSNFLRALRECLMFHYDIAKYKKLPTDEIWAALHKALYDNFFISLYVERVEYSSLLNYALDKNITILSGPLGSGKSTLLMKLYEELKAQPHIVVHYINLKMKAAEIRAVGISKPGTVCEVVYDDLCRDKLESSPQASKSYRNYKLRHHISYRVIRDFIEEEICPRNEQEMEQALSDGRIKALRYEIDVESRKEEHIFQENLRVLLNYLSLGEKTAIIIVDNIDRYPIKFQSEILRKALELRSACKPIIAIRKDNLDLLNIETDPGKYGEYINHLELEQPRQIRGTVVESFIDKRIQFLLNNRKLWPGSESDFEQTKEYGDFLRDFPDVVDVGPVLRMLTRWFNCSLRHVSEHVTTIIERIQTKADPAYPPSLVLPLLNDDKRYKRLRNYVLKTLTCDRELLYDSSKATCNAYNSEHESPYMPFPKIFLLDYLKSQGAKGHATFKKLRHVFAEFGIKADPLKSLLEGMRKDQGIDGSGLLIVNTEEKVLSGIPEKEMDMIVIEMTNCGEFFVDVLRHTCEYLFWTALDTPVEFNLLGGFIKVKTDKNDNVAYEETGKNQPLRIGIAAIFLEKYIAKKIIDARYRLNNNPVARDILKSMYPRMDFCIRKSIDYLRKHLDTEDSSRRELIDIMERIDKKLVIE
jgi:GTPase SAR1 family protein